MNPPAYGPDPVSPNTTYVQADPATFRSVVQKLTGASEDPTVERLPVSLSTRFGHPKPDMGPRKPAFKLHERRQAVRKLELNLAATPALCLGAWLSPPVARHIRGGDKAVTAASPVSTLEFLARGSPRTPRDEEEEERAIAEKGFYLHPSPLATPRPRSDPPELLHLFPLHSPTDTTSTS